MRVRAPRSQPAILAAFRRGARVLIASSRWDGADRLVVGLDVDQLAQDPAGDEQQLAHLRSAHGVDDLAALAPGDHQRRVSKDGELLGEAARLDGDRGQQLVHRVVALGQQLEDADAPRVAEGFEELGLGLVQRYGHA